MENQETYGIMDDFGQPEVNTWHINQLVKDFKAKFPVLIA
jgi:hypothetical protein